MASADGAARAAAQRSLLAWFRTNGPVYPWRARERDPYAVLVSEVMLQQTQASRVAEAFPVFMERFPDVGSLAGASRGDVVRAWGGLGYPRRAASLHEAARRIVREHRGAVPTDLSSLLALPGIGPYTARAVLAFAFERDVAVVDTNVGRILARTAGRSFGARAAQEWADAFVPDGEGWAWNQAMLDLGATVCTKRAPRCERCPAAGSCGWTLAGRPDPDPAIGSHAVSRGQSRFEGSFRQGRSRLLDVLRQGDAVSPERWAVACGWSDRPDGEAEARRAAGTLVVDGLALFTSCGSLTLP